MHYSEANLADPAALPAGECDAALAVILFNYPPLDASGWERLPLVIGSGSGPDPGWPGWPPRLRLWSQQPQKLALAPLYRTPSLRGW
ncbi:MAG: hypothetical protein VKO39_05825 [Cyanobacteriota bacterium]|nr:hypothetical protein [Cyanobacteriota bacterium]